MCLPCVRLIAQLSTPWHCVADFIAASQAQLLLLLLLLLAVIVSVLRRGLAACKDTTGCKAWTYSAYTTQLCTLTSQTNSTPPQIWQSLDAGGTAKLLLLMPSVDIEQLRHVLKTFDVMQAEVL